jgi:hypothetical protein
LFIFLSAAWQELGFHLVFLFILSWRLHDRNSDANSCRSGFMAGNSCRPVDRVTGCVRKPKAVRNTILSVDRREQMSFPVELFLTVDSWRLPVRNRIPDGFRLIPDGFRPTGKSISLVVCSRCGLRLVTHKN